METFRCIQRKRNKQGKIVSYVLESSTGISKIVEAEELKRAIMQNKIRVVNMTLTKDNRLIVSRGKALIEKLSYGESDITKKSYDKLMQAMNKAKVCGIEPEVIITHCGHTVQLFKVGTSTTLAYVPDDVKTLVAKGAVTEYITDDACDIYDISCHKSIFSHCQGEVYVFGGKGLNTLESAFAGVNLITLDLTGLYTNNIESFNCTFLGAKITNLKLGDMQVPKVKGFYGAFLNFETSVLDLRKFKTSNVEQLFAAFAGLRVKSLRLIGWDTSKVELMNMAFQDCYIQDKILNLCTFTATSLLDIEGCFAGCNAEFINLDKFKPSDRRVLYWQDPGFNTKELKLVIGNDKLLHEWLKDMGNS